jgi:transcriptional regulator with GAF, ATPase, and Fis domain
VERRFSHLKISQERDVLSSMKRLLPELDTRDIICSSEKMMHLLEQADQVAETDSVALILGETGTGKELLASRIHNKSHRSEEPFVIIDLSTISHGLLESELFGHERGAFTGADRRKIGRIELANKGTLFLDEIGELPLPAQVKLLRVIQEKEFGRVGGTQTIRSDFRLIAATNRNLDKEVAEGRFRQDLYYRLRVIPLQLPALRDRREDIPHLANYFLEYFMKLHKKRELKLTKAQNRALHDYQWPGNVRELKNVIERAVLLSEDNLLDLNLPSNIQIHSENPFADFPTLEEVQRRYIDLVIKKTGGKIGGAGGAAEILGMNRTSVYSRMRQLKIDIGSLRRSC